MNQQELPILMQGKMIRAMQRGDKTETRRIRGLERANECPDKAEVFFGGFEDDIINGWWMKTPSGSFPVKCPYGAPGTKLWLREATVRGTNGAMYYAADKAIVVRDNGLHVPWTSKRDTLPSILMRREYCRMRREVLDIACERLQDITEEGAQAEGISFEQAAASLGHYRFAFIDLWDSINARPRAIKQDGEITHYVSYPWENVFDVREHRGKKWFVRGNPHLWVVKFKMLDSDTLEG